METTSLTCRWVTRRLPLLAGGELVGADRRRVERHLISCPDCRSRRDAASSSLDLLRAAATAPVDAAPSLWPALARQIRESRRPERPSWAARVGGLLGRPTLRLALAGVVVLGLAWTWSARRTQTSGPTPVPAVVLRTVPGAPSVERIDPPAEVGPDRLVGDVPSLGLERFDLPVRVASSPAPAVVAPTAVVPRIDPFQGPQTLRLDFDLDQGVLTNSTTRDTQRAY